MDTIAWSCGGGIQSVAIGVLIVEGVLPKPDFAGIADTSREMASTWEYLDNVLNPYMLRAGVQVERVPHDFARVDLYDKHGTTLMPAYTNEGRLGSFCSGEWKRDAMLRWLRSKGVEKCVQWIGFSTDEMRRCGESRLKWARIAYPLIDLRISREGCKRIIEKAGLPLPSKSRCWCCPHQNAEEWREVQASPDEWAKAVALDEEVREMDPRGEGLFLHSSRVPLALADIGKPGDEIPPLFRQCQDAGCYT